MIKCRKDMRELPSSPRVLPEIEHVLIVKDHHHERCSPHGCCVHRDAQPSLPRSFGTDVPRHQVLDSRQQHADHLAFGCDGLQYRIRALPLQPRLARAVRKRRRLPSRSSGETRDSRGLREICAGYRNLIVRKIDESDRQRTVRLPKPERATHLRRQPRCGPSHRCW